MEWMLDLTAEELEERSREELKDLLNEQCEEKCAKHINKCIALAVEQGKSFVYMSGFSPSKNYLPLFGENMPKDVPYMTEKLKVHLESKGLMVFVYEPLSTPYETMQRAYRNGHYYAALCISWEKPSKTL